MSTPSDDPVQRNMERNSDVYELMPDVPCFCGQRMGDHTPDQHLACEIESERMIAELEPAQIAERMLAHRQDTVMTMAEAAISSCTSCGQMVGAQQVQWADIVVHVRYHTDRRWPLCQGHCHLCEETDQRIMETVVATQEELMREEVIFHDASVLDNDEEEDLPTE